VVLKSLDPPQDVTATEDTQLWFALRTRSNYERVCAASLSQKGYETFLPMYRSRRRRWDRTVAVEFPLFPSYLFCRFDFLHRLPILMCPGVVHIVGGPSQPEPVSKSEIATIRSILAAELQAEPWPFLEKGERVRIVCGPLAGAEGLLVEFKGGHRLVVSITLLQRSIAAEIEASWVRPAPRTAILCSSTNERKAGLMVTSLTTF
jgi:transcription antitermination factor NusG